MQITDIRVLRGPNYWSISNKKLIYMMLDVEEFHKIPVNFIDGFPERLKEALPGIVQHRCGKSDPGGFLKNVERGISAAHVVEHIAVELQSLAGLKSGFGRSKRSSHEDVFHVVFSYEEEEAGEYTARAAVDTFEKLADNTQIDVLKKLIEDHVSNIEDLARKGRLGPSTASIVYEAERRGIPHIRLNNESYVQLGYGFRQKKIMAASTQNTSSVAVDLVSDKHQTKIILNESDIPVPASVIIEKENELENAIIQIGFPIAIKPLDSSQGKGVSVNIISMDGAYKAFADAAKHSKTIMVEKALRGSDFRILVINNKFVAASERIPAHVTGNGMYCISELIEHINLDPRRGEEHDNLLSKIVVDEHTLHLLKQKDYTVETILPEGEVCYLKTTANLSTGGMAIDRTDEVHPENIKIFERIARIIGLDIAGIDVIAPDLKTPLTKNGGGIIEVNAAPGLRMHLAPSEGKPRDVAKPIVDMLFPDGKPSRIPIFSITGTNGKTTTTRLVAHICRGQYNTVGFTTTDGIYINEELIMQGDNTGPISANMVLKDPSVEIAVLETARGGILRAGLGFEQCDIGAVLNISADHLGLSDINSIEEMAYVKSLVPRSVRKEGYAILNADDNHVYKMKNGLQCNIALFSMGEYSGRIKRHIRTGGIAAIVKNDAVVIFSGNEKIFIEKLANIPLTFNGKATFMVQNVLAAVLICYVHGLEIEIIRRGLTSFYPSPELTPGRLNLIDMENFNVLVDYAHNPAGFKGLEELIKQFPSSRKTGIFSGTGDRRDEDLIELGKLSAGMFDNIIIKEEKYLRGRNPGEMYEFILKGISNIKPSLPVKFIPNESDAIDKAINDVVRGELIVLLCDDVPAVLNKLRLLREKRVKEENIISRT